MKISQHLKYPLFLHHPFIFNQFSVFILCEVMFIIMVLGAQILVSWLSVGSTHIGKHIFQKVNKIFIYTIDSEDHNKHIIISKLTKVT